MAILVSETIGRDLDAQVQSPVRSLPISGFGSGTMITTTDGAVPVEWLRPGDPLVTFDGTICPVRWVGRDALRHAPETVLAVELRGADHPTLLAARHRVVLTGWQVELNFGLDAVLVEAEHVAKGATCFPESQTGSPACSLILLGEPRIIQANGHWVETLQLTERTFECVTPTAQDAIRRTQPDMDKHNRPPLASLQEWEATELRLDLEAMLATG